MLACVACASQVCLAGRGQRTGAGAAAEQLAFTASVLGAFCAGHGSPPNVLGVVGTWHCGLPTQSLATALLTAVWPQTTNESSRIKSDRIDDHSNDWKSYLLGGAGAGGAAAEADEYARFRATMGMGTKLAHPKGKGKGEDGKSAGAGGGRARASGSSRRRAARRGGRRRPSSRARRRRAPCRTP